MANLPSYYVGKIVKGIFSYYDSRERKNKFKVRPLLVIGHEKSSFPCDFNVLPVSKITKREHIHAEYDIKITGEECSLLSLHNDPSYIRTHKQSTVHNKDVKLNDIISDLNSDCPDLFEKIKETHEKHFDTLY